MAKPNAYQLEQLKGRNPDLYKGIPQDSFDKKFPPAPPAGSAPAPAKAKAQPKAVAIEAPAPAPVQRTIPAIVPQVQPKPPSEPVIVIPKAMSQDVRMVPSVSNLEDLKTQFIKSRSRSPLGEIEEELAKKAIPTAEAIMGQAFTPGGERPLLDVKGAQTELGATGLKGLVESLGVQRILTPEQKRALDVQGFDVSQKALEIEQKRLDATLREAAVQQAPEDTIRQLQQKRMNIDASPEFAARKADIETFISQGGSVVNYIPKDLTPGGAKPYVPLEDTKTLAKETAMRLGGRALTKAGAGGTVVESPVGYAGRLLSAPVSAGVGLAEAAITDKTAAETVPARIREGRAAMGGGYDIGKAASDAMGLAEGDPGRQAAQYIGGGAGLILDMMIPVVPGSATVRGAISGAGKAAAASRALSIAPKYSILNAALRGGAREAVSGVPLLGRLTPRLVDDIYSSSIARFGEDVTNKALMKDILKVSGELDEAGDVAKLVKDKPAENKALIETAMKSAGNNGSADQFMASARALGFDLEDAATHGRIKKDASSNLRKSVLDEGLSDDTKLRLGESNAQLTDADLAELYLYLSRDSKNGIIDLTGFQGPTKDAINAIRKAIPRAKTGSIKRVLGVLDDVGTDALAKHYLYTIGAERLTDALVTPDLVRISRNAFVPKDKAKEVYTKIQNNPLVRDIRPQLIAAINRGEKEIRLPPQVVDDIVSRIGPDTLRGRGLTDQQKTIIREMADLVPVRGAETPEAFNIRYLQDYTAVPVEGEGYRLTLPRYNQLVEIIGNDIAIAVPGSKTVFEVSDDLRRMGEGIGPTINKTRYYNDVLKPKEVAGGTLESTIKVGINKALGEATPSSSVASKEFIDQIGQKWGSIDEDFKATYRAARGSGLSAPDAWSKTMVENYIKHASDSLLEARVTGNVELVEEILKRNYSQMFDDYFAQIYGGYESVIDAVNTTGRTNFLDGMLVAPFEMRKLVYIVSNSDNIAALKERFIQRAVTGNFGEALVELRNAHAVAQGKPISAFIPNEATLEALLEKARASDTNGILGYLPSRSGGVMQGDRGAFEIWNYARESAPMFTADDHLKLLSSQYLVRRQSAIVSETYNDWAKIYPEIFPTSENIAIRSKAYVDVIKSYPDQLYSEWAISLSLKSDDMVKIKARVDNLALSRGRVTPYTDDSIENIMKMFEGSEDPLFGFRQLGSELDDKGPIISNANEFLSILMKDVMRITVAKPEIAKKLYVSQVVDSLTMLSASEESANVTLKLLDKQKDMFLPEIIDSIELKLPAIIDELFKGGPRVQLETEFERLIFDVIDQQRISASGEIQRLRASIPKKIEALRRSGSRKKINLAANAEIKKIQEAAALTRSRIVTTAGLDAFDKATKAKIDKIKAQVSSDIVSVGDTPQAIDAQVAASIAKEESELIQSIAKEESEIIKIAEARAEAAVRALYLNYEAALPTVYNYLFNPANLKIHRQLSGADDYVKAIYSSLRAETTPLFYDTLKTSVRNAAASNVNVITKGPLEQIQTIPLTFQETASAKKALLSRSGIEAYTDTMEELRIHSSARKVENMPNANDLDEMIKVGLSIVSDIKAASIKAKGTNRLFDVVADAIGSPTSLFNDGALLRYAKGGVLGGQLLPNLRYLGTNYLTAPAIIYSTLGSQYAAVAARASVLLDFDTNSVMKIILGTDSPAAIAPTAISNIIRKGGTEAPRVIVKSPTGKVYTNYDIASLVTNNSIARSQASAELTNNVIEDIISWSAINVGRITDPKVKNLATLGKSQYVEALKKSYLKTGGRQINAFQELGQMSDTMFRTSVLKKALAEGLPEDQALTLARESLFDYNNLTQVEKDYISKMFWFWTFRRNAYRNVVKSFLTNPARLKNTYLANGYFEEMDRDNNIATKEYVETRPFIHLVDDKENKQRFGIYGPGIPMLQASAELIDYISYFPMIFTDDKKSMSEKITNIPKDIILGYASEATPVPQTIIGLGFGVDPTRDGKELGYSIDPRFMWYLTRNPERFETFQAFINLEVVPPDSEVLGRGTYQGRQWRIRKGDQASVRNWFAINQALLIGGVQRNLRDFAPLLALGDETGADQIPVQLGGGSPNQALINLLYSTGVITPVAAPTYEDQLEYNRRMIGSEFREGTYKVPVD